MNDTYILLKDLPNVNRGTKIMKVANFRDEYACADKFGSIAYFKSKLIETNPTWFKKEQPKQTLANEELEDKTKQHNKLVDDYNELELSQLLSKCKRTIIKDFYNHIKTTYPYHKKEQPKKEYEILSFINPHIISDIINYNIINNKYSSAWLIALEYNYPIHSVKRLSDNEVFSIGDFMTYKGQSIGSWDGGKGCPINKFSIKENEIYVNSHYNGCEKSINDWIKVKQPTNVFNHEKINEQLIEIEKCQKSPYYFATTYLTVNGKPFKTHLSEESFNKYIADKEGWIKSFQTVKTQSQQPTKLPLFKSENGKDIFEGDDEFDVNLHGFDITECMAIKINDPIWFNNNKIFSTRKAAETFVIENKPCLSCKEVSDIFYAGSSYADIIRRTKELAKQKLNINNK